jgi:hypothetical protein
MNMSIATIPLLLAAVLFGQISFGMEQQLVQFNDGDKAFTCFSQLVLEMQDKIFACSGNKNNFKKVNTDKYKRWSINAPGVYRITCLDPFWINNWNSHETRLLLGAAYFRKYDVVENIFNNSRERSHWHLFNSNHYGALGLYRIARHNNDEKMINILKKHYCCDAGASKKGDMPTILMMCCYIGDVDRLSNLINTDITILQDTKSVNNAVMAAASERSVECLKVLLENKNVWNCITSDFRESILQRTVQSYRMENILEVLLASGFYDLNTIECQNVLKDSSIRPEYNIILQKYNK